MEAILVDKGSMMAVGVSLQAILPIEREERNIPKLHDAFESRISEIEHRMNNDSIGIFIDPPNYDYRTDPFTWMAAVEVSSLENIPEGMSSITLPASTYVRAAYQGQPHEAYQVYDFLYNWIEQSTYELADSYGIEIRRVSVAAYQGEEVIELMLPIISES
ncbi:hypothetical protein BBG47_03945 [Paenibacillus sp. KS1]|uniref:GyrI-like domain-containing protein n=1 Tax=Paenibacillus sp. KS1 TaxID=1849249 RepID=UPI0008064A39|nr:GyrI-like domain-containing protein [Paenibacillus sp. KS1]OBY80989.1 hypothetical protein BBG47_03945 [Paenibacillus sp. KS1]